MAVSKNDDWACAVLDFWFEELEPEDWFSKSDALDELITRRFAALHEELASEDAQAFLSSAKEAFAAIILFDQLSRNVFRDHARAFETDPLALAIARGIIAKGWDNEIEESRRVFAYLPFEHSEILADQDTAVELIAALGDYQYTRYAHAHRDVIKRFGRFPHRNAILSRSNTPEEEECLAQPGSGF